MFGAFDAQCNKHVMREMFRRVWHICGAFPAHFEYNKNVDCEM